MKPAISYQPRNNLSGFASLREIAAIKGREEFFTLRRKGAKETYDSKLRISVPNLSVLASLRETSVTQGREEFFTLRRKGAKETYDSKLRISVPNLSGFASLRETSVTQGRPEFFTPRREVAKDGGTEGGGSNQQSKTGKKER
jgi:hypothetical protein